MQKATIANIARYLNKLLRVREIQDSSRNGLQVKSRRNGVITTVGFAVDACLTTFELARRAGVELLVVHHGVKWRPQKDRVLERRREAFLRKSTIALYAVHLPLDLHAEYGNNAQLARMLGLGQLTRFGRYHGIRIGCAGTLEKTASVADLASRLANRLPATCRVMPFGAKRIRTVGIVSGGGGGIAPEASLAGLDCFVVGEADLALFNTARDHGLNVIAAGHYATETVGVRALMQPVKETFGVNAVFLDDRKDL